jgi:dTDP-4-amino-4,6-dideoxygalactose transaminase
MTASTPILEVPFFDYPDLFRKREDQFVEVFRDVCRRGAFIKQKDLRDFESSLASFLGARYVLGVGNATDGLEVALRAAGIGPGDEVIFSSHTMIATAVAIHYAGATPVPVECGSDHLIDPTAVEAAVTRNTRAVMPTQLNGRTADMGALQAIAARHDLVIIEDAAQALGSRFRGQSAGTFGVASAISFYPAKLLGCFGDGGAVVSGHGAVFEQVCALCNFGYNLQGELAGWGFNSRLDNLQAAFLSLQLQDYAAVISRRRHLASLYSRRLADVAEVVLPPAPDSDPDHFDVYQNYEVEADQRGRLKQYLANAGIGTLIQWGGQAVHQFKPLAFTQHLPYTDWLLTRLLMLPLNMSITDDGVHYVCDKIRAFYGR